MADKPNILGTITKIVVIGGAILLFALLAYLIITWVPKAISGIANIGSSLRNGLAGEEQIQITINDSSIENKKQF